METMQMSLEWARGRLINVSSADYLIDQVSQFIQEIRTSGWHAQQARSGYRAPRTRRGAGGAPCYAITQEQLRFLMSCAFSVSQMADILHVSTRRLRHFNLSHAPLYSDMSDLALDENIKDLVAANDKLGPEAVRAQLRALGMWVQRRRVRDSMLRVGGCTQSHVAEAA